MPEPKQMFPASAAPKRGKLRADCVVDPKSPDKVAVSLVEPPEGLAAFGGSSEWPEFNRSLVTVTIGTIPATGPDGLDTRIAAACAALAAFKPADEIEGMIAAQAVALHHAAMECFRRAALSNQPFEIACKLRRDAANMARGLVDMLDAMDRKRGKGPQVVRVERVVVHEGGKAIVGNVAAAAGGQGVGGRG